MERLVASRRINGKVDDFFGRRGSDFFDVHAALGRADKTDAAGLAIHEQGKVKFGFNACAVFDVDTVDDLACGAGLVRDQCTAQHLLGFLCGFFDRFGQTHATCFTGAGLLECALAAATCVDLRLDYPKRPVQFARRSFCVFGAHNNAAFADRSAVRAQ